MQNVMGKKIRLTQYSVHEASMKAAVEDVLISDQNMTSSDITDPPPTSNKDDLGDMTFCMSNYAKEALKMMYMMRQHHMLTDVVLEVEQELFHVHKVVLSSASPYFKAMFTGGLKESEMSRVKLQGVCPMSISRIISFMYTGRIRVTEVTVCQLLPAATMFQVPNVIEACCAFLERQLDPTNAIGIANFAEQHGCAILKQKANQFIERHFTQICQEEEFLQLSAIQLVNLIRKDELNVQAEREVYNAVLKWVKYDENNRYPKMEQILYAVRCQFLTPKFLKEQMKNCDVLRKVPACREYLAKIFKDLTLHKRPVVRERKPNTTRMIFVAGGYFQHSLDILEGFNVDDRTWTTLPKLTVPRSGLGAAFLKGTFYAVGGRNNAPGASYDSDWVDRYNPVNEAWRPCAPMSVPRNRVGVAVMDEFLYAVGGSSGTEYHNSVEYFDPEQDRWTTVARMSSKRLAVGVAVVNRLLYAIGGFDGENRLASVECYHPENNAWSEMPAMKSSRSGAGVAVLNQYIYVVGGFDGNRQLSSVERFDTDKQTWELVTSMKTSRSALSVNVIDGKLYAMGGYDGTHFLANVEVYDPVKDFWEDGIPLSSGRSGLASAVIYTPSCTQNYMDAMPISSSEYDDEKKPEDDDGDDDEFNHGSHGGASSSFHFEMPSNFFSSADNNNKRNQCLVKIIPCQDILNFKSGKLKEYENGSDLLESLSATTSIQQIDNSLLQISDGTETLCNSHENHTKPNLSLVNLDDKPLIKSIDIQSAMNNVECPIQKLKKHFRHFIFRSRDRCPNNVLKKSSLNTCRFKGSFKNVSKNKTLQESLVQNK